MFRLQKLLLFLVLLATSGEAHCPYNRIAADKTKRRNDTAERARLAAGAERRRARKAASYAEERDTDDSEGDGNEDDAYVTSQQKYNKKLAATRKEKAKEKKENGNGEERKRKPAAAKTEPVSKKRGRPAAKNADMSVEETIMTAPKRRGRKPKSTITGKVETIEVDVAVAVERTEADTVEVDNSGNDVEELQMDGLALITPQRARRTRKIDSRPAVDEDIIAHGNSDEWKTSDQMRKQNWEERFKEEEGTARPSTERVRKSRRNNEGESDTDEEKDDIQEPSLQSPFNLDEQECLTCLARIYGDDRTCCQRGRVFVPPPIRMPPELEDLFYGSTALAKKFQAKILAYNSLFSFASNQYEKVPSANFGPQVVKVLGTVNSFPSNALPMDANEPAFANFYVKTGKDALESRFKSFHGVDKEVLEIIQKVMEAHNEMAKSYHMLGKFMEKAKEANKDPERVRMKIIDSWNIDKNQLQAHTGVYRRTSQGGDFVCVFYTASIDQQVTLPGLIIYPKKKAGKPVQPLFYWDPKVSPLCYALFFPYGEYGFQQKKFIIEEDRNKGYWERYVEYYLEHPEEAKLWETSVSFEEAEKKAEESRKSRSVPKKNSNIAVVFAPGLSDAVDDEEMALQQDEMMEEMEEHEESEPAMEEVHLELEAILPSETAVNQIREERRSQPEVEMEELIDYGMTVEELRQDDEDIFREHEPENTRNGVEELDDDLNNVVFSDSDEGMNYDEKEDIVNGDEMEYDEEVEEEPVAEPKKIQNKGKRKYATRREYEVYNFQDRRHVKNRWMHGRKLSQLYLVHTVTQIQQQRSNVWRMKNMEYYNSTKGKFLKAMNKAAKRHGKLIGCLSSVPSSFPGSPRWLYKHFLNAVTMCNRLGKCDLFITATTNVNWPEIKDKLLPGQTWADRPFLVNQVFNEKLKKFMDVVLGEKDPKTGRRTKKGIFGRVKWYTYSVEFQQRGPPHAHLVFSLKRKIKTTEQIEKVCQAELSADPKLKQLVEEFMTHRPCEGDPNAYCREKLKNKNQKKCAKGFPKEYCDTTKAGDRHYPELKRRHDGRCSSKDPNVDNRYIVPYNATLLSLWKGHMNVEVISSLRVVKYLFKYLFKGFDRALVEAVVTADNLDVSDMTVDGHLIYPKQLNFPKGVLKRRQREAEKLLKDRGIPLLDENGQKTLVYDEFVYIQDMRALTSCEAAWDLAGYPRHGASHVVFEQRVHEENEEPLRFKQSEQEEVAKKIRETDVPTPFKAWFKLNENDPEAHQFNYGEIAVHYSYKNGKWIKKKRVSKNSLGAVATVSPRRRELFAIRLLALARKGVTSFQELRSVDNVVYPTFVDAAKRLGLMTDQGEWEECLKEAAGRLHPKQMRRLFSQILTSNPVANPKALWENVKGLLYDDNRGWEEKMLEAHALYHIASFLSAHQKCLSDYDLPEIDESHLPAERDLVTDVYRAPREKYEKSAPKLVESLNSEQRENFEVIFGSIMKQEEENTYFVQGSGGTGKTALTKAIYYSLMAAGKKVACVAHTGAAATLLPSGTTAHRLFSIPLAVEEGMHCQVEMESVNADNLSLLDAVFWDEATMTDWRIAEAVHHFFYRLTNQPGRLFGGVAFIFSGDWKQTLPIIPGVHGVGILDYTLLRWQHWPRIQVLNLTRNMRAAQDVKFAELLEEIGRGSENIVTSSRRPEDELIDLTPFEKNKCLAFSPSEVIRRIFGTCGTPKEKCETFEKSAILTVDNKSMDEFNEQCLKELLNTPQRTYFSIDEYDEKTGFPALDPESYHKKTPPGMPPHELNLKKGVILMLLRNVNTDLGLSNGTRMILEEMDEKAIYCRPIKKTKHTPDVIGLSRVLFSTSNALTRDVAFKRTQFPVRLSFCMTCNKSQGQTLGKVGVILRTPCFAHGQFYVALSRVRSFADLVIYNASKEFLFSNNVVHKEIFQLLQGKQKNNHTLATFPNNSSAMTFESSSEDEEEIPREFLKMPRVFPSKNSISFKPASTLAVEQVSPTIISTRTIRPLDNLGQTCYANSAIQMLERLWKDKVLNSNHDNSIILALKNIITQSGRRNAAPLLKIPQLPAEFKDFTKQQSSAELIATIFEHIPYEFKKDLLHLHTPTYECMACGTVTPGRVEAQSMLPLDGKNSHYETFEDFVASYMLQTLEKTCEECWARHPEERSLWYSVEHREKWNIEIPQDCKYLAVEMGLFERVRNRTVRRTRTIGTPPAAVELFGHVFKPIAAIWHRGNTPFEGHYKAFIEQDGRWWECDDSAVEIKEFPQQMNGIVAVVLEKVVWEEQEYIPMDVEIQESSLVNDTAVASTRVTRSSTSSGVDMPCLLIEKISIIDVDADVIVNPANARLDHGGGVDGIIRKAAGSLLIDGATDEIRSSLPNRQLAPGQVVFTKSYQLTRYKEIFHTAAPVIPPGEMPTHSQEEHLKSCYFNSLLLAEKHGVRSIAFPLLGTGIYNYDEKKGMAAALQAVFAFFESRPVTVVRRVHLVAVSGSVIGRLKLLTGGQSRLQMDPASAKTARLHLEEKTGNY